MQDHSEILERLRTADWAAILTKLIAFAHRRGRGRNLRGSGPKDVAMEAVVLVFEGAYSRARGELPRGRYWDGNGELLDFLRSVVNSQFSNHHRSTEKKTLVSLTPEMLTLIRPEELALSGQVGELDRRLTARTENHQDLKRVYRLILEGITSPSDIAYLLDLPVLRVKKLKNKLRSIAQQLRQDIA